MVVNYCGKGNVPGTVGPGGGGITGGPTILVPGNVTPSAPFEPPLDPPRKPRLPSIPRPRYPQPPTVIPPAGPAGPANPGGGGSTGGPRGPSAPVPTAPAGPSTGGPRGPTAVPPAGPGISGPSTGGPRGPSAPIPTAPAGPTTGGTQMWKCVPTSVELCQESPSFSWEELGNTVQASLMRNACIMCSPTYVNNMNVVVPDPFCIFTSKTQCDNSCILQAPLLSCIDPVAPTFTIALDPNTAQPINTPPSITSVGGGSVVVGTGGGGSVTTNSGNPNREVINRYTEQQEVSQLATVVNVGQSVAEGSWPATTAKPELYDSELNFFAVTPRATSEMQSQHSNSSFKGLVASEVSELLETAQSTQPWNEVSLQSITDDRLITSLDPRLISAFQVLRYPGGELVGLSTMLGVVRRHLLEGTMDEFDSRYYTDIAESQRADKITVFEPDGYSENNERFVLEFLRNSKHTYENTTKNGEWANIQIGRMRPLNVDLNISLNIEKVDSSVEILNIPNDGVTVSTFEFRAQDTPLSVGSPTKLNIGNGWGYYFHSNTLDGAGVPVNTNNIIEKAYYAPPATRDKALNLLGIDPSIIITAESLSNQHEYVSGDAGASALRPLYFGINLSSVTSETSEASPLVEVCSSTYLMIEEASSIDIHLNNNALNVPILAIDYRDPIYRYILDTSTLTAVQNDFTLVGFRDNAVSGVSSKMVRNIPYGFVIIPVRGSKYNPLNGRSLLDSFGDTHVRSLPVRASIGNYVDSSEDTLFPSYNLYNKDGSRRIGIKEIESVQNFGYSYDPSNFTDTFFSAGVYGTSAEPVSAYGAAYLAREVIDYIHETYSTSSITWYDIYSRMPSHRVGELFYDGSNDYLTELAKGYRHSITIDNVENSPLNYQRILPEDSKTVVKKVDRKGVTLFDV